MKMFEIHLNIFSKIAYQILLEFLSLFVCKQLYRYLVLFQAYQGDQSVQKYM